MSLGHHQFRLLPLEEQLPMLWVEGTFLAWRWEEEDAVGLYHLPAGFFCEIYYEPATHAILRTRCFTSAVCLEDYTHGITLNL